MIESENLMIVIVSIVNAIINGWEYAEGKNLRFCGL